MLHSGYLDSPAKEKESKAKATEQRRHNCRHSDQKSSNEDIERGDEDAEGEQKRVDLAEEATCRIVSHGNEVRNTRLAGDLPRPKV
jgi:hypothetical protein